jgi:triacylglycerol esterase/lipase EstA (alpha/beta hydrolase family)
LFSTTWTKRPARYTYQSVRQRLIGQLINGYFTYPYLITSELKQGNYTVTVTDEQTGKYSSQEFYVENNIQDENYSALNLTYPNSDGIVLTGGENLKVVWEDYISFDNRYRLFPDEAKREYNYQVELMYLVGEGLIVEDATVGGASYLDKKDNFNYSLKLPVDKFGKFMVRIYDNISNLYVEGKVFNVVQPSEYVELAKEWDYSVKTADGTYHRLETPKGVAADGTSRIYLTLTPKKKAVKSVTVSLTDSKERYTLPELIGKITPATVTNTYSEEANNANTTTTQNQTPSLDKYYFWYVAPDDFEGMSSEDAESSLRIVNAVFDITYTDNTRSKETLPIEIVRPAVMLVHGLANNGNSCWENFKLKDNIRLLDDTRFTFVSAIDVFPDSHFEINARGLLGHSPKYATSTFSFFNRHMRFLGYASNRVDYICHSMGGCILRYAAENYPSEFYSDQNYGRGYTNKVITINTPHEGSPIGDGLKVVLDMFYEDKYVKAFELVSDYIINISDMYEFYRADESGFNLFYYIKPYSVRQNTLQGVANWGQAVFGGNWSMPLVQEFKRSPAVVDLSMADGVRFNKLLEGNNHLIAGDIIEGVQNIPTYDMFEPKLFEELFSKSKALSKFLGYFEKAVELINDIRTEDVFDIIVEDRFDDFQSKVSITEKYVDDKVKLISYFDNVLTFVNVGSALSHTTNFVFNSDFVVSLNSQLAGSTNTFNNQTIINGWNALHTKIVDNPNTQNRVSSLLQSSVKSSVWGPIPASITKSALRNSKSNAEKIILKKTSSSTNTDNLRIVSPDSTPTYIPGQDISLVLSIPDTANLEYVEIGFQGEYYKTKNISNTLIFDIPVSGNSLKEQRLLAKAFYNYGDSVHVDYTGIIVNVIPQEIPLSFSCLKKVYYCENEDIIRPGYKVIYPSFIYRFGISKDVHAEILGEDIVEFDSDDCSFIAKKIGSTYIELDYQGLKDTIYIIVGSTDMSETTNIEYIENKITAANNIEVYPNPVSNVLTVKMPNPNREKATITLMSLTGRIVFRTETHEAIHQVNVQSLERGIYILQTTVGNEKHVAKVLKK